MAAKALIFMIAAFVVSACAQMPASPPGGKGVSCPGASCDVKVSVTCSAWVFCKIETDPELLLVPKGNSPVIHWGVVTSGYAFSDNGIAFEAGSPFTCRREGSSGKFMCNDDHIKPGTYKYTITLTGFPFVLPSDPWIQNE